MRRTRVFFCLLGLCISGCTSMWMVRLPLEFQVVDKETKQPISDANARLVWRIGFGGITWGKPVVLVSDSNGMVRATGENIPPLDETGYRLDHPLREVMIDRLIVKASGYKTLYFKERRVPAMIEMEKSIDELPDLSVTPTGPNATGP